MGVHMDLTKLLCDILIYVPVAFLSIYLTVYLTVKFSFYNHIDKKRESIRAKTAEKRINDHKNLISVIDNVHVKYIRVLVKKTKNEDRGFRLLQYGFCLLSIVTFFWNNSEQN